MAYTIDDFPISTEAPQIEVTLPVGTHVLELVVEDSAGLRSLPDTVVITVEPAAVSDAAITGIEPTSALQGASVDMFISGTGLSEATGVVFYTKLAIKPLIATLPTLITLPTVTKPTITLPTTPTLPLINVPDNSITSEITTRSDAGIGVKVTLSKSTTAGVRTFALTLPGGTVSSGALTFHVMAIPTITIPTVTIPTLTIPTITNPTVTIPTVTIPTITKPTVTIPTITIPTPVVPPIHTAALPLTSVNGVGAAIAAKLAAGGITSVSALASASPKKVADILNYKDQARVKALIDDAAKLIGQA
jgi:hypothetical protein